MPGWVVPDLTLSNLVPVEGCQIWYGVRSREWGLGGARAVARLTGCGFRLWITFKSYPQGALHIYRQILFFKFYIIQNSFSNPIHPYQFHPPNSFTKISPDFSYHQSPQPT